MKRNKKRNTPIPLLALQMAIFNTYPTKSHKNALAALRAKIAEDIYHASVPRRERK